MYIVFMMENRAFNSLNLKQYSENNYPDVLDRLELDIPQTRQYVLRILIKRMFGEYKIPDYLLWTKPLIEMSDKNQKRIGVRQPFVYLTIRNGLITSETDDEWHVDGFSQTITHLPEQNYIWTNNNPTEYVTKPFIFPKDFDPLKHNIHNFFQNRIEENDIKKMNEKTVYGL